MVAGAGSGGGLPAPEGRGPWVVVVDPVSDRVSGAVRAALVGLRARIDAHSDNLANVETPGWLARRVSFEDALWEAWGRGADPAGVRPAVGFSDAPTRTDGNNVAVDTEMVALTETALRQALLIRGLTHRWSTLGAVLGER